MKIIRIQYDYSHGPLWQDRFDLETGEWSTGIAAIDGDATIQGLNSEAQELYESLFSFGPGSNGCRFDDERFRQIRSRLLSLTEAIVDRLRAINDGSYTLEIMLEDLTESI